MDETEVLREIERYFASNRPSASRDRLGERPIRSLLQDSLDAVEFLIYLEDRLGLEGQIDPNQFGPSLVDKTFAELAREIAGALRSPAADTADGRGSGDIRERHRVLDPPR
jgi:hypothetical protein